MLSVLSVLSVCECVHAWYVCVYVCMPVCICMCCVCNKYYLISSILCRGWLGDITYSRQDIDEITCRVQRYVQHMNY